MTSIEEKLIVFKGKKIRRTFHQDEWWFSVVDIIEVLSDSDNPKQYIKRVRSRDHELSSKWGTLCTPLELTSKDGKKRKENCANTEGIFRIIQSIPSPKAEPFKRWLAKVGYERIQEIENPELAQQRTRHLYKSKGYSDEWIEKRLRGIAIREELTDEWGNRGIEEQTDFAILTTEIHQATFGITPVEHKSLKTLKRENLRDHMNDLELIFSMLGEASTTEITRAQEAQGFPELKTAAKTGGKIAGNARKQLEIESGKKVVTEKNYLSEQKKIKGKASKP